MWRRVWCEPLKGQEKIRNSHLPRHTCIPLATIFAAACCTHSVASDQVEYRSEKFGYAVAVPEAWTRIPDEVLRASFGMFLKPGSRLVYDMGFQPEGDSAWLSYPYVLVQIVDYKAHGIKRQPREKELGEFVKVITQLDFQEAIDRQINDSLSGIVTDASVAQPLLDRENRRFHYEMTSDVALVGQVRAAMVGYFGHESLVQVMYYDRADRWEQKDEARSSILGSLRFDPDRDFKPNTGGTLSAWLEKPVLRGALTGAIGGAIAGAFIALSRRFRKERQSRC